MISNLDELTKMLVLAKNKQTEKKQKQKPQAVIVSLSKMKAILMYKHRDLLNPAM